MLWRILLAFTLIPLIELYLLWQLADEIGLGVTILLVLVTGFLGSLLARSQGLQTWRRFQDAIARGRMPAKELQEGLLIVFAAAMLLTPGILTDVAGFLLLVPWSRRWVRVFLAARLKNHFHLQVGSWQTSEGGPTPWQRGPTSDVVDAEGVRSVDDPPADSRDSQRLPPT